MFRIINTRILDLTVKRPFWSHGTVHVGHLLTFSTDAMPGKSFHGKGHVYHPVVNELDRSVKVTGRS